jgi:hypothetical protein
MKLPTQRSINHAIKKHIESLEIGGDDVHCDNTKFWAESDFRDGAEWAILEMQRTPTVGLRATTFGGNK